MNDLICLSHLRWNFVWQRPQHLMSRFACERRVYFVEEPHRDDGPARLSVQRQPDGVVVVAPHVPGHCSASECDRLTAMLLDQYFATQDIVSPVLWYYTPMALKFTRHWSASAVVYDCMDELSGFVGAPPELPRLEHELMRAAGVVFTGGQSLFEAKRALHPNIHPFPSSVDVKHFSRARAQHGEPGDQAALSRPRVGFFGVLDERLDRALVDGIAAARPEWQIVMLGPVVKIDPNVLPRRPNIHYLGGKSYEALPEYVSGWDVAMLPFARNDATRFISPTKTPEYLAAGRPVVSTSIRDVVRPYGDLGLALIADEVPEFVAAVEKALAMDPDSHRERADRFLATMSWDATWARMRDHVERCVVRGAATADARPFERRKHPARVPAPSASRWVGVS